MSYVLDAISLLDLQPTQFCFHSVTFLFTKLLASFSVQKLFIFMSSHLSVCGPSSLANLILFGKHFPTALSCSALRMFSYRSLRLSSFSGVFIGNSGSNFIFLCMDAYLPQDRLLKVLFFSCVQSSLGWLCIEIV